VFIPLFRDVPGTVVVALILGGDNSLTTPFNGYLKLQSFKTLKSDQDLRNLRRLNSGLPGGVSQASHAYCATSTRGHTRELMGV
jgi:hypothetical protein